MPKLFSNVLQLIGNTPIVKINKICDSNCCIYAKLEAFNPGFSVKDRIALSMIEDAKNQGKINQNTTIIEPTSGNTGIGLAIVCSVMNLKLILTMPENMSIERQKLLKHLGANVVLTDKALGMKGAVEKASELNLQISNSIILSQFANKANPIAHEKTTAVEIFEAMNGKIDFFVSAFGTAGTVSGVGKKLKELKPDIKIFAVEPEESPLVSKNKSSAHKIQGIGANFVPEIFDKSVVDYVVCVSSDDAIETSRNAAKYEGILCGISSGAALYASCEIAKNNKNKNIVTILPDLAERYISTELFEG